MEIKEILLTGLLSGGILVAVIQAGKELILWRKNRKATKEDRETEKTDKTDNICNDVAKFKKEEAERNLAADERMTKMEGMLSALVESQRLIMLNTIQEKGKKFISEGEISFDDRRNFHQMHNSYHYGLGGNGDADFIVDSVDELPLKK